MWTSSTLPRRPWLVRLWELGDPSGKDRTGQALGAMAPGRGDVAALMGAAYCDSDSHIFCSPSSVSRLMLEEEPTPATGVHPRPKPPASGDSGGPLAVTPCAWSDPRPLPPARFLSPDWESDSSLSTSQGTGGTHRVDNSNSGRKGDRWEHPMSLAPAAVLGTPSPSTSPPPFLSSSPSVVFFFVCVNCYFYLIPFFPPEFSQRNKGLEIAGSLVLVISMEGSTSASLPFSLGKPWLLGMWFLWEVSLASGRGSTRFR